MSFHFTSIPEEPGIVWSTIPGSSSYIASAIENPEPFSLGLELLARFELAAVLPRNFVSWEPYDLTIEIDEVASSIIAENKNPSFRMGYGAASQIWTGDLILTNYFEAIFALRCLS